MSYVPPHLRKAAAAAVPGSTPTQFYRDANPKSSLETLTTSRKLPSSIPRNGGGASLNSSRRHAGAAQQSRGFEVPDPVFEPWRPSDRVLSLTPEQIEEVQLRLNVDVLAVSDSLKPPAPIESFNDMGLNTGLMKDIAFHEYTKPTPIQAQAMPVALSGRDLLGCAETGSGKTAAFSIPMIQHCLAQAPIRRGDGPLALVLAPTRELAQQIETEVKAFSRSSETIRTAIVVGGINITEQVFSYMSCC
ncbi:DEAD-box ATP-dependent RNA helicase 20 [Platanthera guangdongensis]|uniref:DEAD-box ATP-dependent RNA helicase 20 n=1 Tax=Platanthera guangdongensis TaxID=2320717 RepID=A0ABR2M1B0_9ASPA